MSFDIDRNRGKLAVERNGIRHGGGLNAGNAAGAREQAVVESDTRRPLAAGELVRADANGQDVRGIKARVRVRQFVETSQQKAGADQQDQGERHFAGDDQTSHAGPEARGGALAARS